MFISGTFFRKTPFILLVKLVVAGGVTALADANSVPVTRLMDQSSGIPISNLAPPECDGVRYTLETIILCAGGTCNGTSANELLLGTSGNDTIDGKNGDDCIVGGGGDDILYGNNGNDVLVGGPGTDTLDGGQRPKDTDLCADHLGISTFIDCEIIQ